MPREDECVQRPEAVVAAAQAETFAFDQRRAGDRVANLVRMDARNVDERGEDGVDDERARDDRGEGQERPVSSPRRHRRDATPRQDASASRPVERSALTFHAYSARHCKERGARVDRADDRGDVPQACRSKRALIIGIAGQDGSLLAELLLSEGYEVFGVVRQPTSTRFENLEPIRGRIELQQADVLDELSLVDVLSASQPHEVYNLASPSFVPMSWKQPVLTAEFAAVGVRRCSRRSGASTTSVRFYQASSSEIFGESREVPQTEETPLAPVTPYGVAKAYGHFITRSYRRRYGLFASSGILYNHESPRRPLDFVTRKVSHAAAAISLGLKSEVLLGNLDARRDWGYAGDYVRAMWLVLQQDERRRLRDRERADPQRAGARCGGVRARGARLGGSRARGRHPDPRQSRAPRHRGRRVEGARTARLVSARRFRGSRPAPGRRGRRAAPLPARAGRDPR